MNFQDYGTMDKQQKAKKPIHKHLLVLPAKLALERRTKSDQSQVHATLDFRRSVRVR